MENPKAREKVEEWRRLLACSGCSCCCLCGFPIISCSNMSPSPMQELRKYWAVRWSASGCANDANACWIDRVSNQTNRIWGQVEKNQLPLQSNTFAFTLDGSWSIAKRLIGLSLDRLAVGDFRNWSATVQIVTVTVHWSKLDLRTSFGFYFNESKNDSKLFVPNDINISCPATSRYSSRSQLFSNDEQLELGSHFYH